MNNHGELAFGEIPAPLKYVRPTNETTLANGIRVVSEAFPGAKAHVGVYVGSGSRNETLDTTGSSYLVQRMATRGTTSRTKSEFSEEVGGMGASYSSTSNREWTSFDMSVLKGDTGRAINLLGDAVCNPTFNSAEFEVLKEEVSAEHESNHTRYEETTLENCFFNSFREHMIGQPVKGDRDMLQEIGADHLRSYHTANYYGDNIVIVATGDVNHAQIVEQVEQAFAALPKTSDVSATGTERPIYTPSILFIRDDEMINSNVGIFYDAPSVKHEDYYSFLLLKHMFGSYRVDQNAEHLNDVHKQYNSMHALLGNLPDVTRADSHYFAGSDYGLFGNYFFGNEVFTRQMNYCGVCLPTIYSHYLNEVEVFRGRNHLFNQLLTNESAAGLNKEIGMDYLQLGFRRSRTEIATRVASIDAYHIK